MNNRRQFAAILAGLIAYLIIGWTLLSALALFWTDYSLATKERSFTISMLVIRMVIAAGSAFFTGIITAKISKRNRQSCWMVALIIFIFAGYRHFVTVWNFYPIWYHLIYLFGTIPLIGITGYFASKIKL